MSKKVDRSENEGKEMNRKEERDPVAVPHAQRSSRQINALVLLKALQRRWFLATLLGITFAGTVGAAIWIFLPPAEPLVYAWIMFPEKVGATWFEHPDPPLQRQTQGAMIRDQVFLAMVIKTKEVKDLDVIKEQMPKPEEWLARELRIEFPSGPELMQLAMSGNRPDELKVIVGEVRKKYLEDTQDKTEKNRFERLENLRKYDSDTKRDIEQLRFQLKRKAESGGDVKIETVILKQKIAMELLEQTKKELVRVESDIRQLKIEERSLAASTSQTAPSTALLTTALEDEIKRHPLVQPYERRIQDLKESLDRLKSAAPTNPKVSQMAADIEQAQKDLAAKKLEIRPMVEAEIKSKQQSSREVMLAMVRGKIKDFEELQKTLLDASIKLNTQSRELNEQSVSIDEDNQKIAMLDGIRSRLILTIEQLSAEKKPPPRAVGWSDVGVMYINETVRKARFAGIGAVVTLAITLLIIALMEIKTRRLLSPDDVVVNLGMPVVGTVPAPPRRFGKAVSAESANELWQTMLTESVDSFRTQLLHTARKNGLQVVMVSSAATGEGKTSLSCHLAVSLARSGLKTLLVDADLRNPSAHDLFQLPLQPGLCEVLLDSESTADAVQRTQIPGLWLLPAGMCSARVIELLAQAPLQKVFEDLREEYDFIVVDTSPILPVTDPLLIAQHADGVVFSFMREVTRLGPAKTAIDRLRSLNVRTLGAVVNGTRPSTYGYNRRYYSYPINN